MKGILILLLGATLILAVSCAAPEKEIVYINNTIIEYRLANSTPCAEIPDCICYEPECDPVIKEIIPDGCPAKLNMCHIRIDAINDQLYQCLLTNLSMFTENLSRELYLCETDLNESLGKLEEIGGLI